MEIYPTFILFLFWIYKLLTAKEISRALMKRSLQYRRTRGRDYSLPSFFLIVFACSRGKLLPYHYTRDLIQRKFPYGSKCNAKLRTGETNIKKQEPDTTSRSIVTPPDVTFSRGVRPPGWFGTLHPKSALRKRLAPGWTPYIGRASASVSQTRGWLRQGVVPDGGGGDGITSAELRILARQEGS